MKKPSPKAGRKAQSFSETEIQIACNVFGELLSGGRPSSVMLQQKNFVSLHRKFVQMQANLKNDKKEALARLKEEASNTYWQPTLVS
ncbi:hypothetical protein CMI47_20210 [Candidatus Pacearchaeota archaeon]|nr:hypothetical protein [Candidatus Pacearchaeota archaeon]